MKNEQHLSEFLSYLSQSLTSGFVKMTLGAYAGAETGLKNIYIRKVSIKDREKLSLTYRYQTRDIVKNHDLDQAVEWVRQALTFEWKSAVLHTDSADYAYQEKKNGKTFVSHAKPTMKGESVITHNREKNRLITASGQKYLQDLGITNAQGDVFKNAQDKFRQINKYIEILSGLLKDIPSIKKIADMGSGKGYLTFALYDYLHKLHGSAPEIIGVEYRKDLVDLCNNIAKNSSFEKLHFVEGSIQDFDSTGTDVMIALHACDTATDDAIFKGIANKSRLIVVAPCCHKQIRREMEQGRISDDLRFLTRHGTYLERQAEMATDGIRALVLEYFGYNTKVFEFISDAHTPKNVMIVGELNNKNKLHDPAILAKITKAKEFYGIGKHYLETLTGLA